MRFRGISVELIGHYSNLCDQGKRLLSLREIAPTGPRLEAGELRQSHRRPPSEQIDLLVAAYLEGTTVYELAKQFDIHRATVSKILKRQGVTLRLRPLTSQQIDSAIALYKGGLSLDNVGKHLSCDAGTVRSALAKAGVEIRRRNGWPRS